MRPPRIIYNLALVGFMGSGKSSVGRLVAARLKFRFVDTDELVERRAGAKIADLFARCGEAGFRELERSILQEVEVARNQVISTGGGLVAQPGNLESLRRHALVICLWASPEAIWRRVRSHSHRPLLRTENPMLTIRNLLQQRQPYYRQADVLLNTDRRSVAAVAQQVIHHFRMATTQPNLHA
jgi:shikimate kinase